MNTDTLINNESVKPSIVLSEEQQLAANLITSFLSSGDREFKLGGYAGTGKTTLIKHLRANLNKRAHVCAFTGKAVNVLSKKDVPAQTIHSSIYDTEVNKDGTYSFFLKSRIDSRPDYIIVDEASMVSTELYKDLLTFGKPIIFIGDPGQLEPVGDNPNLMSKPDFVLSKIHRQVEKSPIIKLATQVRNGGILDMPTSPELYICCGRKEKLTAAEMLKATQVLCAKNITRVKLNSMCRKELGYTSPEIQTGERLICLKNNRSFGVFNGMMFTVEEILTKNEVCYRVNLRDELGNILRDKPIWRAPFVRPLSKNEYCSRDHIHCDFAYAITVHKSQGSEWEHVLLYDEWMPPLVWDMKRWRYTGITRASQKLTVYC
jgi:exodeoxyribonuclease-5